MAAASSMEKVPDVLANQTYVVHRSNAPKGTIQALKVSVSLIIERL